jgi:16S rRNA (guanine1207-N2)-methyltransferase
MSHYFHTPTTPEHRRQIRAHFWDTDWEFTSADGVFSYDSLDQGTAVLLREVVPPTAAKRALDLGCGYGVLAIALASAVPGLAVDAVDVNERALALTAENAATHQVADRVRALLPAQVDPDVRYDEIWSNPPIRIGKQALHELLLTWLPRLAPGGRAVLVVGRNLGADSLQAWLNASGFDCERIGSAKGFRLLQVRALT